MVYPVATAAAAASEMGDVGDVCPVPADEWLDFEEAEYPAICAAAGRPSACRYVPAELPRVRDMAGLGRTLSVVWGNEAATLEKEYADESPLGTAAGRWTRLAVVALLYGYPADSAST